MLFPADFMIGVHILPHFGKVAPLADFFLVVGRDLAQ
jgi:hypothetical protein